MNLNCTACIGNIVKNINNISKFNFGIHLKIRIIQYHFDRKLLNFFKHFNTFYYLYLLLLLFINYL